MPGHVQFECLTVGEFLGGDRKLVLPWFQRSYAWGERQVGRLMSDLRSAMQATGDRQRYFLGHIYLARPKSERIDQLIDGNQRITTLTILFSILRDQSIGEDAAGLHRVITAPETTATAGTSRLRLNPQPSVAAFLERYVQSPGGTRIEFEGDLMALSQTERAIFNNREQIKFHLAETPIDRAALARFIQTRCCLTVSTVEDPDEAWDMLATEEETGLKHHDTDRAKYSLLAPMPRDHQGEAARIWDTWVARIGPDRVQELLGHMRTLDHGRRSTKPIEEDLIRIYRLDTTGIDFLEKRFAPRAGWLDRIVRRDIATGPARALVAERLETLSWLDQSQWMAAAVRWLETRGDQHEETPEFFFALDRLAWILRIAGTDPVVQERRYIEVCEALKRSTPLAEVATLTPERKLVDDALSNLASRTFEAKRYSDLVLRRISLELGRDSGPLDPDGVTVEHVLPRNPIAGSEWWRHFRTRAQIAEHANRLGNLAFLTRPDNQRAATQSYEEKRRILAGSAFLLANDAATVRTWNAETIRDRTQRLMAVLLKAWRL